MYRDAIGEVVFWAAVAFALVLYGVSAPAGLPWNASTDLALAWSGQIVAPPGLAHPVWGYFVQVFYGHHVALSIMAAAFAAGLIGAIVNRYLGWRLGAAAALAWIVWPGVWNRAITGDASITHDFCMVLGLWAANALFLILTQRVQGWSLFESSTVRSTAATALHFRIISVGCYAVLGASVAFAAFSIVRHDYSLGEPASAYARVMLDEIGTRCAVLNGVADSQMVWEAERRAPGASRRFVQLRNDDAYRASFAARVKREWPTETNLWVCAQMGPKTFADRVLEQDPDRVYVMTGASTTPERWAARWKAMTPCLGSSDPFVAPLRRAFAREGVTLAARLRQEGRQKDAWGLYWRIYTEIDPHHSAALIGLGEMLWGGYPADESSRTFVEDSIRGLVRDDERDLSKEELLARARERLADRDRRGERLEAPAQLKTLVEWGDEMLKAHYARDFKTSARIARTILSQPEWRNYTPANAVMGSQMARSGDYESADLFYRAALNGTGAAVPKPVLLNDYADTLLHLAQLDEAERYARQAVALTGDEEWLFRLTLAEILKAEEKNPEEIQELLKVVIRRAPFEMGLGVRKEFRAYFNAIERKMERVVIEDERLK